MSGLPPLDHYDLAAFLSAVVLLVFGYVVYPTQVVKVSVWLTIFTIEVGWITFFAWKLFLGGEVEPLWA